MTYLFNDPVDFADEMVEGFVAANGRWVRGVRGGVVRGAASEPGTVAVVIGGGSGHYPAFGGLVGPGLAAGAAMGNLFASPSARQVLSVAKEADAGGGVLLTYGNYAGDVLNFDQAEAQLRVDGVECLTVVVTDDVSSAPPDEPAKRRGVAGGLVVYKVAGAAAQAGLSLHEVAALATRANSRTRTIGVAFSGCTLPGASEPLFTVGPGVMEVGMGIHGEPGLSESPYPTADELAELFLGRLIAEVPADVALEGARVVLILNGLGSVKYEELFVVYRRVAQLVAERGLVVVDSKVGEFVTSFEMAGASLTVCWLDADLERLWLAPATSPAFTQVAEGLGVSWSPPSGDHHESAASAEMGRASTAGEASVALASDIAEAMATAAGAIAEAETELGRLDAIAGDGDHGIGMRRGITAATEAAIAAVNYGAGTTLLRAGDSWADRAGGTSGAIWGIILRAVGAAIGDDTVPDTVILARAVSEATAAVAEFGKVTLGDKTLYDVLAPFSISLAESADEGDPPGVAWERACRVADAASAATAQLIPRVGRARPHAEKSVGVADPGAVSLALLVNSVRPLFVASTHSKGKASD
ncbi:MAG TPA: dihydroxyacetone kinase family protein [Galbitalea sp.]|nr:dihydroxyacetone kinase family protein [Galbitalea sp.]